MDIVVGYYNADVLGLEFCNDVLNIFDGNGVYTGKGSSEE